MVPDVSNTHSVARRLAGAAEPGRNGSMHRATSGEVDPARRLALRVIDDGVGLSVARDGGQMPRLEIGRAQHDAARPAVEFDQRGGRLQLVAGDQHHRAAVEPIEAPAKTCRV